jgi:hypothetical protein
MVQIFDGRLHVHYGQAYIEPSESSGVGLEDSFCGQNNGLCGAASPGTLFLLTGLHTGDVSFVLDVLDAPPPLDDTWEEIVEVSFAPSSEKVILSEWGGEYVCDVPLLQEIYRVRYCARDMDRGKEINTYVEGEPVDFYALTFWRADSAPDVVIKQTSQVAAYWHNWVRTLKL